jgi:hypothetical protein
LYGTPFWTYPSQFTLVNLIKLKRTQTVCTEKERKNREKTKVFSIFFLKKKNNSRQNKLKNKKNALTPG